MTYKAITFLYQVQYGHEYRNSFHVDGGYSIQRPNETTVRIKQKDQPFVIELPWQAVKWSSPADEEPKGAAKK